MSRIVLGCFVFAAIIGLPSTASAQIWMRRSEVSIPVDGAECMARAFRSLRAEGFAAEQNITNGVWGKKGSRWTLVLCNAAPAGATWVNVVSSALDAEAGAHYAEHERVAAHMSETTIAPVTPPSGCGWRDAQDPAGGRDPGRGVTDRQVHLEHITSGRGVGTAHELVGERLGALSQCLPRESYAGLYTSVSVAIADGGRRGAGWLDGMDSRAGNDPGRGLSDKAVHYDHIASGRGVSSAHTLVAQRLATLSSALSRDAYARLYADLSVMIARCGDGGTCR